MEDEPAYHITITQVDGDGLVHETGIRRAVKTALRRHHTRHATLNIALVDDERMAYLNRTHLHHDGPTDVLAFDMRDQKDQSTNSVQPDEQSHEASPPIIDRLEGEIILCTYIAEKKAQQRGHSVEAELALYAVHGTLHLLGYQDHNPQEATRMHKEEDKILTSLGIGPIYRCETG